ncbi:MAG: DUF1028 domain-containing protein [candidate division KSB1 bacterium]|nr:DUF1028 domain-containing protein [candidate division KSB1 bacterium]MDZ7272556.1 DUF1028 domain-containing protein [candidate division KSB1 bacterium]MDZ7284421.1 DUF1028 domain-containing protein [candidate division KSB1 bacterium]MDZ7297183.1 DUF1028 domain-containing protein [candidate division KSB1 bacterium]MDZ7308619.1 DUF1028 domain-containing protein [candidate division KSB1 bacterium]
MFHSYRMLFLFSLGGFSSIFAQESLRPVHTYSIVARDPATGQMGVAVQSHWFSVGSLVTWAEAGVGAVATQSFVDPAYGPLGLELMRAGKTAPQALAGLIAADPGEAVRQVAMIDAKGNVAAHTGSKCIPGAGHIIGDNFSVQANLMLNDKVWPAMAEAYKSTTGDLADKMLAALDAAQAVGGDIRGKQSAAILIVSASNTGRPWVDRVMELRVEDHPEPLKELRRLVNVHRAYQHMNAGDLAVEHGDMDGAMREYGAAEAMFPDNLEMAYWHAVALVNANRLEESLPLFKKVFTGDPNWAELTPRLPGVGLLNVDDAGMKKILSMVPRSKK